MNKYNVMAKKINKNRRVKINLTLSEESITKIEDFTKINHINKSQLSEKLILEYIKNNS